MYAAGSAGGNLVNDRAYWLTQIQRYADGQLGAEEVKALAAALRRNGPLRRDFLELLNLDAALVEYADGSAALEEMVADLGLPSLANSLGCAVRPSARESSEENASKVTPLRRRPRSFSPVRGFLHALNRSGRDLRYPLALVWIFTFIFAGIVASVTVAIVARVDSLRLPVEGPGVTNSSLPRVKRTPPSPDEFGPVARLARSVGCTWAGEIPAPQVGEDLAAGRELVLKSGLAEIIFADGAQTILQGPATLVVRSRASAILNSGKCSVTVEHPLARGFAINTPGMKYTDLGTEFGVLVAETGEQEVHVFRGKVQADEAGSREAGAAGRSQGANSERPRHSSPVPAPRSMLLTAHQAIRLASPGAAMVQMAADEKRFVRVMLDPIPLFGTGLGLDRGAPDPHWEITAVSSDLNFKPQAAVVAVPDQSYVPDNPDRAQWISNSKSKDNMPAGCRWTFVTHFDLAGFDASTARIEGQNVSRQFCGGNPHKREGRVRPIGQSRRRGVSEVATFGN